MKKVALITGASRGIGRAIALRLAKEGYRLMVTCVKSEELLLELKAKVVSEFSGECETFVGDVGRYDDVIRLFEGIKKVYGRLDVIVNNAAVSYVGVLQDMKLEDWDEVISTNLNSVFYCCKLGITYLFSNKEGKIINISSVWGNVGASCEVAYSASKGGVNSFTKALAKELAPSNIQVNAVACGVIETDMNQFLSSDEKMDLVSEIPIGRMGTTDEVADVVTQLVNGNAYLTGQIITLDGGWI